MPFTPSGFRVRRKTPLPNPPRYAGEGTYREVQREFEKHQMHYNAALVALDLALPWVSSRAKILSPGDPRLAGLKICREALPVCDK